MTKRSGATEPFSRDKVLAGVRKACQGRPVTEDDLALLGPARRGGGPGERRRRVEAHEVGLASCRPLRELDEVAYLRFASVYRAFDALEAFEAEIALLRAERDSARTPARATADQPATKNAAAGDPRAENCRCQAHDEPENRRNEAAGT